MEFKTYSFEELSERSKAMTYFFYSAMGLDYKYLNLSSNSDNTDLHRGIKYLANGMPESIADKVIESKKNFEEEMEDIINLLKSNLEASKRINSQDISEEDLMYLFATQVSTISDVGKATRRLKSLH